MCATTNAAAVARFTCRAGLHPARHALCERALSRPRRAQSDGKRSASAAKRLRDSRIYLTGQGQSTESSVPEGLPLRFARSESLGCSSLPRALQPELGAAFRRGYQGFSSTFLARKGSGKLPSKGIGLPVLSRRAPRVCFGEFMATFYVAIFTVSFYMALLLTVGRTRLSADADWHAVPLLLLRDRARVDRVAPDCNL